MERKDLEQILTGIETFLNANLNTEISAIATEKGDGLTFPTVNSSAYFWQTFEDDAFQYDPFVLISVNDIPINANVMASFTEGYDIAIVMYINKDTNETFKDSMRRALRYREALIRTTLPNFAQIVGRYKFTTTSLAPTPVSYETGQSFFYAGLILSMEVAR